MHRRDMSRMLFGALSGGPVPMSDPILAHSGPTEGTEKEGPRRTAAELKARIVPVDEKYPFGDLRRYGGDATGSIDSSSALQTALSCGFAIIGCDCTYRILHGAQVSGSVVIQGFGRRSTLMCDGPVATVTDGSGSVVDNLNLMNIASPWIITRDPNRWDANVLHSLRRSSTEPGYQPTVNDQDLWSSLTTEQQNQQIGPAIIFNGTGSHVEISRIYGRFVRLQLLGYGNSSVHHCDIRGGKGVWGSIEFSNYGPFAGERNSACNNSVQYSSFCGIVFLNNRDFQAADNVCIRNGESGLKTVQGPGRRCSRGQFTANRCAENYYDGIDANSSGPASDSADTFHQIIGNYCGGNGGDGINSDGKFNQIVGNYLALNRRMGIWGVMSHSVISGNFCLDNNRGRVRTLHDISATGTNAHNKISGNYVSASPGQNNYGIYAPGHNFVSDNYGVGSALFLTNPEMIREVLGTNVSETTRP